MSKFEDALTKNDTKLARNLLKVYITGDPTDTDKVIENALISLKTSDIVIFDQADNKLLILDKNLWTEEYFVDLQVDLRDNFSEERYRHMLDVGSHVYLQKKEAVFTKNEGEKKYQPKKFKATMGLIVASLLLILVVLLVNGTR